MPPLQILGLEQRLALLTWLNRQFGYEYNRDLLTDTKETDEGFDSEGRSFVYYRLISRGDSVDIPPDALAQYDDNIRSHLHAMNARRSEPITLRYFQHLAALYAEVFLDGYFNRRGEMLRSLNQYVEEGSAGERFTESDLKKLAFWMATGSGKTLIMHLNYRQFLHYNNQPLDNILLITPNEGLSDQHLDEMMASGIPCRRFDLEESDLIMGVKDAVRVIEITKLVEQKHGGGARVPVEVFEGENLVFVDEGHKGSGGEAWRRFRDALGKQGFTFEYSATFGQALTAARNDALTAEYGKAIAFDYSYRYFHGDGVRKGLSCPEPCGGDDGRGDRDSSPRQLAVFLRAAMRVRRACRRVTALSLGPPAVGFCGQYGECGLLQEWTETQRRADCDSIPASRTGKQERLGD